MDIAIDEEEKEFMEKFMEEAMTSDSFIEKAQIEIIVAQFIHIRRMLRTAKNYNSGIDLTKQVAVLFDCLEKMGMLKKGAKTKDLMGIIESIEKRSEKQKQDGHQHREVEAVPY